MELVSDSLDTEMYNTRECSSSNVIGMDVASEDLTEKENCFNILRSHGLLRGDSVIDNVVSIEDVVTIGNAYQEETPKLQDGNVKTSEGISKLGDDIKVKMDVEVDNDCVLDALKEAFATVGYSLEPEGPSSFAEVGNPVMALAVFLVQLVGSDVAVASTHNYMKSLYGNAPGIEIALRCCFLLEDPLDDKKVTTTSARDFKSEGDQPDKIVQQDTTMLDDKDLESDHQKKQPNRITENKIEFRQLLTNFQ
ncbi:unnamed protein product [Vicia faba]|uniref:Uncharacterized protein n=1 Tax=Vicia faba TaxID=3906 RepID=A0AAV0ZVQ3_VICFA|nr:unnamed protein product [Vicia faba]